MVDAARLLARSGAAPARRFLIVRAGATRVALQVDDVVELRAPDDAAAHVELAAQAHGDLAALRDVLRDARWLDDAEGRA